MRRVPIACCLEEGGEWVRWLPRYRLKAPIRLYKDGRIEDDIYQTSMQRRQFERDTDFDSMACPHCGEIDNYRRAYRVSPGIWMLCYECRRHTEIEQPRLGRVENSKRNKLDQRTVRYIQHQLGTL